MKIDSGKDWRNCIQEALQKSKITLLVITPNYKESEVCMCEMGAAWVTSSKTLPFIVDPITYDNVGIIQQPKQIEKLLDEKSLDRLRDIIQEDLEINPKEIKSDRWTAKKVEFLQKVKNHLSKNPFREPLSRDTLDKVLREKSDFESTVQALIEEKSKLEELIDDLKKAKDLKEIKEIEKRHKKVDSIDEFSSLCRKVSKYIAELPSIIRGIVFVSFSGKSLRIRYQGWEEEIDNALSRDYITESMDADWDTTKLMRNIYGSLCELSEFMNNKETDEDFIYAYEEDYEAPLSLSNLEFWEEAFNLSVSIS